jgi:uncharacterized protein YdeI (YjbR/CyaY-like superfamily)
MEIDLSQAVCPANIQEWRQWLIENHDTAQSVWVIYFKKNSSSPTILWSDAVDQAICFGWIDSTRKSVDSERFIQLYTRRKAHSVWSKINKLKVERLLQDNLMVEAGLKSIEIAKANGSWNVLDEVEELLVPDDLMQAFQQFSGADDYFLNLSKSVRKSMLHWIVVAKRPETRQKRIDEIVIAASNRQKPKQF